MALTKLTTELNKISTLATIITGQATTTKAAFDHDVNVVKDYINDTLIPEVENKFEAKDDLTTNRKLSPTGNFTGTWNGKTMVETDPGIQAIVNEHTSQLADIAINVKTFLCTDGQYVKGDGIHDDTTGIRAAVDYCKSLNTGDGETALVDAVKQLFFPHGKYLITSTLLIPTFMTVKGSGKNSTIFINGITDGTPIFQSNGSGWSTANFYNTFSSFSMHGSNSNAIGIKMYYTNRYKIEDVYIDNFLNNGISIFNSDIGVIINCCIRGCGSLTESGLKIDGTDLNYSSHATTIYGTEIAGCYGYGLYAHYGSALSIFGSTIQGNAKAGIHADGVAVLVLNGGYFERNLNHIEMIGCLGANICGSTFGTANANTVADIMINDPAGLLISGNTFARALGVGEYNIGALGTPTRMWTVTIESNSGPSFPIAIDNVLLELIKVGGSSFSSPVDGVPTVYSRTDYYDGLKTSQGNVDIVTGDLLFGNRSRIKSGTGNPNMILEKGSVYLRTDGSLSESLFINIDGSAGGWVPMQTVASYVPGNRPATTRTGFMIFDESLNKPLWWYGAGWCDAMGTIV